MLSVFKNKTAYATIENIHNENSNHSLNQYNINDIINKNLSEELLNSFKKLFSNFASNKEKSKQTLNLYLNGNISINVLTGNTNPQIITKNIYNKDSFNTNKTISYNINSNSQKNDTNTLSLADNKDHTIRQLNGSIIKKSFDKFSSNNKIKNLIKDSKNSDFSNEKKQKKTESELKLNIKKTETKEYQEEESDIEKENKISASNEKLVLNENNSSNLHEKKSRKNIDQLTEYKIYKLLEDEELKSFLKRKIEIINKIKNEDSNRIHVDHNKKHENDGLSKYFNLQINKTLENKLMNEHLEYEKKRESLINNVKKTFYADSNKTNENSNKTKIDFPTNQDTTNISKFTDDSKYDNISNSTHIQNNYYMKDHKIKINKTENPLIVDVK